MSKKTGFKKLMDVVCPEWGFCGSIKNGRPLHVTDFIPERGTVTADQFAVWVFCGEGIEFDAQPERWQRIRDAFKAAFIEHMGSGVVDASLLRWPDEDYDRPREVLIINTDGSRRLRIVGDAGDAKWVEEISIRLSEEGRRPRVEWLPAGMQGGPFADKTLAEIDATQKLDWLRNKQLFNSSGKKFYGNLTDEVFSNSE